MCCVRPSRILSSSSILCSHVSQSRGSFAPKTRFGFFSRGALIRGSLSTSTFLTSDCCVCASLFCPILASISPFASQYTRARWVWDPITPRICLCSLVELDGRIYCSRCAFFSFLLDFLLPSLSKSSFLFTQYFFRSP